MYEFHGWCSQCAEDILRTLGPSENVRLVRIKTKPGAPQLIGAELPNGRVIQISETGLHVGVEVGGSIVDNIFGEGLPPQKFLEKLAVVGESPTITVRSASGFFDDDVFNVERFWKFAQSDQ